MEDSQSLGNVIRMYCLLRRERIPATSPSCRSIVGLAINSGEEEELGSVGEEACWVGEMCLEIAVVRYNYTDRASTKSLV